MFLPFVHLKIKLLKVEYHHDFLRCLSSLSVVIVRDDCVELFKCELLVRLSALLYEHRVHQVQQCVVVQILANRSADLLQLLETNHSCLLLVVKLENSLKPIPGFVITDLCANDIYKLLESKIFVSLPQGPNNLHNIRISFIKTNVLKNFDDFLWINNATSVLIKD